LILRNKRQEEDEDPIADGMELKDKVFSWWLTFWHLLLVLYYSLYFVGVYQFETPETGYPIIALWQPYSPVFFPFIVAAWYCVCFLDRFENLRQKFTCCFSKVANLNDSIEKSNQSIPQEPNMGIQLEHPDVGFKKASNLTY